jgi:signal transduction histidine kinase
MEAFRRSDFRQPVEVPAALRRDSGDEIDRLGVTFDRMVRRIVDQIGQIQHADASRRELIANVSHDLRTPLASLQGAIETLLIKGAELSEAEKRRYLDLALKNCKGLGHSTVELFELATLESHDRPLCVEPFSIAELVQDVAQKFRPEAERRRLTLETDAPANLPFVSADIGLIERVFENLIENAMKYTPAGGTIRLSLVSDRERAVARVADTGRGIPAEDLPRVFDRSYRVDRERGDAPEGAGLGLAIAKRILELHGSSIGVESAVGAGTTFSFDLAVAHR